jgi:hypothetical protein
MGRRREFVQVTEPTALLRQEHPPTLDSMKNLALVLKNQGKYGEAEAMLRKTHQEFHERDGLRA